MCINTVHYRTASATDGLVKQIVHFPTHLNIQRQFSHLNHSLMQVSDVSV